MANTPLYSNTKLQNESTYFTDVVEFTYDSTKPWERARISLICQWCWTCYTTINLQRGGNDSAEIGDIVYRLDTTCTVETMDEFPFVISVVYGDLAQRLHLRFFDKHSMCNFTSALQQAQQLQLCHVGSEHRMREAWTLDAELLDGLLRKIIETEDAMRA